MHWLLPTLAGCALHALHYEPAVLEMSPPSPLFIALLPGIAERDRRLGSWSLAEGQAPIERTDELPSEVLYAMFAYSRPWTRGAELDLLVDLGEGVVPVTLWWGEDRSLTVAYSDQQPLRALPPYEDTLSIEPWAIEIAGLYGLGGFDGDWTVRELGDVAIALQRMDATERRVLSGVHFVRDATSNVAPRRELASFDPATEPPTLSFYDLAFDSDDIAFVGPIDAPVATGAMTALHEFGHALADWPMRLAYTAYTDAFEAWRLGDDEGLGREMWRAPYRSYRALGRKGPVIEAWDAFRAGRRGPTTYGDRDPHESFAEAFALYHLDPDALERALPGATAWFASGSHTSAAGL